jgi:hypothetical protein
MSLHSDEFLLFIEQILTCLHLNIVGPAWEMQASITTERPLKE